ncbi:response regulator transcription factor [Nitrosophilus labii]|uniref:response regulator transcription factor n=1 Tax=Nitrosophilus labii TaxID=2706014 RepID=UPI0016571C6C|nr:DNA-binding response regulator [Nitrosophilus labii]
MKKIKILIVEDESLVALDIAEIVKTGLSAEVKIANSFKSALDIFEKFDPDILFLDIKIEGELDGIDIAKEIKRKKELPVIFITAYNDDKTLQRAFETFPKNFIVKPFKEEDILTSAKLALNSIEKEQIIAFDEIFSFNLKTKELYKKGKTIKLTKKESQLLYLLVKSKNSIVTFDTIDYEIWPEDLVNNNTRRTLIYRLRKKLDNCFLETVFGIGCKLNIKE